jgi:hypothetical protein
MNKSKFKILRCQLIISLTSAMLLTPVLFAQHITIDRIEKMPNIPNPYQMRNWKQAAISYDSFVFDFNLMGQYLPLIWWRTDRINYPSHESFGLHTVVGTTDPESAEAINVIPAVISASLVGIDKNNQHGYNWVLFCEEFFNKRPEENIYLNHPVASSGDDWWYETMPNVFFYQLYDLYPQTGDFQYQFTTIADQWLLAIWGMNGSLTPWRVPNMNHRAWSFSTMTPNDIDTKEPEAAGAIAWLLYNAYVETQNPRYRIGAELAMEFLNNWKTNPSYELQLPYGVYTAARMNVEMGTQYNIQKMLNWCFDIGPLRQWGAIIGNWGGYDVHGLIGEVNGWNDYAFLMNTFEHVGALVPMVRYDDRFARAIGKWVLNAANAARLFYPNYLPDQNQDSEDWAHQYDPNSYIGHEAIRQTAMGQSPYATGDAISGGWGKTNLSLYSSSHVGIFGGIIDTTNVSMILKLDVRKTDYFQNNAYPTFLYFNPYSEAKTVEIEVGWGIYDLYDAVTNSFLATNVSGFASFTIPPDAAVLVVVAPASGNLTYDHDKTLLNGVVVDYRSDRAIANYPPRIKSLAANRTKAIFGETVNIYCTAADRDSDTLTYTWDASGGTISGNGKDVIWTTPNFEGTFSIKCVIDDGKGEQDSGSVSIEVVEMINNDPAILKLNANPRKIDLDHESELTCIASDSDGDSLTYSWTSAYGILTSNDSTATWKAPGIEGNYYITCKVDDGKGGQAVDSIGIVVRDFSNVQTGNLIAYYPFNGNANDHSGLGHHGTVSGAVLVSDRSGNPNSSYYFDGTNDYIRIPNKSSLNFPNAITINFWIKVGQFFGREIYLLSHGSYENRWKISITPEQKKLRWTIRTNSTTNSGIKDLDSETPLFTDTYYNITVLYSGSDFEIYINGELNAFSSWSGQILPTSIDLMIAQRLPTDNNYNFKGLMDDIRIYNYTLSVAEIQNIFHEQVSVHNPFTNPIPNEYQLEQNFPNPFNAKTTIRYQLKEAAHVNVEIYDILGQKVNTLIDQNQPAGYYTIQWDGTNEQGQTLASGIYIVRLKSRSVTKSRKLAIVK